MIEHDLAAFDAFADVAICQNVHDAEDGPRVPIVDRDDMSKSDRACDEIGVKRMRHGLVHAVDGFARDLFPRVPARSGVADFHALSGHAYISNAFAASSARTKVRRPSSGLKSFCPCVTALLKAIFAAAPALSSSSFLPFSASSASAARQGL